MSKNTETISLFRSGGYWVAYHSGEGKQRIIEVFGSPFLRTPFEAIIPAYYILLTYKQLNPDILVNLI